MRNRFGKIRLAWLTIAAAVVLVPGSAARADHIAPEYTTNSSACLIAGDVVCARVNIALGYDEPTPYSYARFWAEGSTRLLPGWVHARVSISCIQNCTFVDITDGIQTVYSTGVLTAYRSCAFPGGLSVSCGTIFDFTLDHFSCQSVFQFDVAVATRIGPPGEALPPFAYTRVTQEIQPCPWRKL